MSENSLRKSSISVIGGGNVATHLCTWLAEAGLASAEVNPRSLEGLDPTADFILVAVADSAITDVAMKADRIITNPDAVIAHTSGSTPLAAISALSHHTGVLYPMQTFTKGRALVYDEIPLFVEGSSEYSDTRLMALANHMSRNVRAVDSTARARIHLGAVFACNFLNYMLTLAQESVEPAGFDLAVYAPLVRETVDKALKCGPVSSQTGPARRNDLPTISTHLSLLRQCDGCLAAAETYDILSHQIMNLYK